MLISVRKPYVKQRGFKKGLFRRVFREGNSPHFPGRQSDYVLEWRMTVSSVLSKGNLNLIKAYCSNPGSVCMCACSSVSKLFTPPFSIGVPR